MRRPRAEACDPGVEHVVDLDIQVRGCLSAGGVPIRFASEPFQSSSSIVDRRLGGATKRPDRVIGMHFMNPGEKRFAAVLGAFRDPDSQVSACDETGGDHWRRRNVRSEMIIASLHA